MKVSSHVVQVLLAGLLGAGLSSIAIGQEVPPAPLASPESSVVISDGSKISFDQDRASITPIKGWQVEPKGSGMSLVMKEVLPVADKGTPGHHKKATVRS